LPQIPVKIPIRVIPIWTADRNLLGELAKSNAVLALLLPFLAAVSNRLFREEINAISDIEKTPFKRIKKNIMSSSNGMFLKV
jgi:hypothetical protein